MGAKSSPPMVPRSTLPSSQVSVLVPTRRYSSPMAAPRLSTDRLDLSPLTEDDQPGDFVDVFDSNPEFVDASESFVGKRSYTEDEVARFLWQESVRENSWCLAIRLRETGSIVGISAALVPNPDDGVPWIGLLLLDSRYQRQGLGQEAAAALVGAIAEEGADRIRLNVLMAQPDARRLWERAGFSVIDETRDANHRPVWTMEKRVGR